MPVPGEHNCLGRNRRDVHRDLPTTVELESLGDQLPRDQRNRRSVSLHRSSNPAGLWFDGVDMLRATTDAAFCANCGRLWVAWRGCDTRAEYVPVDPSV